MTFTDDGIEYHGKVLSLHDSYAVVETDDKEEWEIEIADLT